MRALVGCGGNVLLDGATSTSGTGSSTGSTASGVLVCETGSGFGHVCLAYAEPGIPVCMVGTPVSSCSTTNALGTCTYWGGSGPATNTVSIVYYSDGGTTAAEDEMNCMAETEGTWTPE